MLIGKKKKRTNRGKEALCEMDRKTKKKISMNTKT